MSLNPPVASPTDMETPSGYSAGEGHVQTNGDHSTRAANSVVAKSATSPERLAPQPSGNSRPPWRALGLVFASTILVSAFLLFQVQPLISKYILPWFGGSPAVWTTCMLFFQLVLFGGYAYAHLLSRFLSHRAQAVVHITLIGVAVVLMLPSIAPDVHWKPVDASHSTARILLLLSATVGLPYFVLSTTGPLVQAWFAHTWPGKSPYRLYALSNVGSLAALVTYPFLFEPAFGSDTQAGLWTAAFGLFAALCGLSAAWIFGFRQSSTTSAEEAAESDAAGVLVNPSANTALSMKAVAPTLGRRILWIALPACASLMLLATTNFVCQDVAVMPFLWVIPLSLYLLTFIVAFDHPRWFRPVPLGMATIVLLMLSAGMFYRLASLLDLQMNYLHELAVFFTTMFFACLVCHGQLVRLRPDPAHLTEFYLMISAGGALGGIFVSLIAPQIFTTHFEWVLALAASTLAAAVTVRQIKEQSNKLTVPEIGFFGYALVGIMVAACAYWLVEKNKTNPDTIYEGRNFYGTVAVLEYDRNDPKWHRRVFFSGGTIHGKQYVEPDKRRQPISYFAPHTGIGRTLTYFQSKPDARIGVIGMGVGVLAAYAKPGQYYRFYEINEQVNDVARKYFTYLDDCEAKCDVVLADARLALEQELATGHAQNFDVLTMDAFNGDAPPVHLLTDEAFGIYLKHLKPDGVIVVNVTNHYINLVPVVTAAAKKYGLGITRVMTPYDDTKLYNRTDFMMLSRNQEFLAAIPPSLIADQLQPEFEVPLWTDKYSNLFRILKQ